MCGITGIFQRGKRIEKDQIVKMTDLLRHRGPDDEGYLAIDTQQQRVTLLNGKDSQINAPHIKGFTGPADVFLGHRRLSILDLSVRGHQPFSSPDSKCWIVFNGEIYNYLDLRAELEGLGHKFSTQTDTEVLLAAYREWGRECLGRLNGMWVFVIYDMEKGILFGARDPFGVKPLYYVETPSSFAWASEMKALLSLDFVNKEIDSAIIFDYLMFGGNESLEQQPFKHIRELLPSTAFTINLQSGSFKKWTYFQLEYEARWKSPNSAQFQTYVSDIHDLIHQSIRRHLQSDVPVGTCLSGGVDSSAIVCGINNILKEESLQQIGERQATFTAGVDLPEIDESPWAKQVVETTGALWHTVFPSSDELLRDLEDMVYYQDIPFGSTAVYMQYRVMKLAGESGIKVLLDGQGGDELFGGYAVFYEFLCLEMLKKFKPCQFVREFARIGNSPLGRSQLMANMLKRLGKKILPAALKQKLRMPPEMQFLNHDFTHQYQNRYIRDEDQYTLSLNTVLHQYFTEKLLKPLLRFEDRNSMRFSLESRTPFADDLDLIKYTFQIPSSYKIYRGWSKYLLREASAGIVPDDIRWRRDKLGFVSPEGIWLEQIKKPLLDYLTDELKDFIRIDDLRAQWDKVTSNQSRSGITNLWRLINFMVWKKVYQLK